MVIHENIHSSNMVQTDSVILRDIYVYECSNNYQEKGHVLGKKARRGIIGQFEGKKGTGEMI